MLFRSLYGNTGDTTAPATNRLEVSTTGDVEVKTGNLVIGTSGKGIDFSAATPDGTGSTGSEVLDDYEEGTWTPILYTESGVAFSTHIDAGRYIKIGSQVYITARLFDATTTTDTTRVRIFGLPFAGGDSKNQASSNVTYSSQAGSAVKVDMVDGANFLSVSDTHDTFYNVKCNEIGAGLRLYFSMTYTTN